MSLDARLRKILVCPIDHGELVDVVAAGDPALYNPRLRKLYRIDDDIPVLLIDEASDVAGPDHEKFVAGAAEVQEPEVQAPEDQAPATDAPEVEAPAADPEGGR